jgi:hypothetical protein
MDEMRISDFATVQKGNEFLFEWELEKRHEVYKLFLKEEENTILGLISLIDYPDKLRIHINLIEVAIEQVGKGKEFDHIAGCLIAFACSLSFKKNYEGFVSLTPKTNLIRLYQEKYGFRQFGRMLGSEYQQSKNLIDKYIGDE